MPSLIRTATADDVPAIVAILIETKRATHPGWLSVHDGGVELWSMRWRRYITEGSTAQHAMGDSRTFLMEIDGSPRGFAAYHTTRRHGVEAELQSIYVRHADHGQGVGTQLLRTVAGDVMSRGLRSMCVGYDPANLFKRFYMKHGAVEIDPHWAVWADVASIC